MFKKQPVIPPKSDLQVALEQQQSALRLFEGLKGQLERSNGLLDQHEQANAGELARLQGEQAQIIDARARNLRVKAKIDEILT